MSNEHAVIASTHGERRLTLSTYVVGFVLSIILTVLAYALVRVHVAQHHQTPSDTIMQIALPLLAIVQFFVQLIFFLHLRHDAKPRWRLLIFWYMITVVLILVLGSVWIMYSLNYRMFPQLTPKQINQYMLRQDGGL